VAGKVGWPTRWVAGKLVADKLVADVSAVDRKPLSCYQLRKLLLRSWSKF